MIFFQADVFDLIAPETAIAEEMAERALAPPDPTYSSVATFNVEIVHNFSDWETCLRQLDGPRPGMLDDTLPARHADSFTVSDACILEALTPELRARNVDDMDLPLPRSEESPKEKQKHREPEQSLTQRELGNC
ncbi:hypothetical protein BJX65DRAFT_301287 [Aspergillus insuetus]